MCAPSPGRPDRARARAQRGTGIAALPERLPSGVELLTQAEAEGFTCSDVAREQRRQIASTNPRERLTKALKRRRAVVGRFANRAAAVRLRGAVRVEQHEEGLVGRRYVGEPSLRTLRDPTDQPAILPLAAPAA